MFQFHELNGFIYVGDFLFIAGLTTIILKLKLENSSQGFSAKTQGVYGVVLCTRNIDLLFVKGSVFYIVYCIFRKIASISCIIYIVFKIKKTSKNNPTCNCNQDSFWVEALVLPCIIITAVLHYGGSPEEVLWSFSTYLEAVAMVPQFYLIHVRGKGDSYLAVYIALMALYSLTDALAYSLNTFIYHNMPIVWPICKCLQLALYIWYIIIPRVAVLPVANCEERRRRPTLFMRQQSLLAQTLLQKTNSSNDLQVFVVPSQRSSSLSTSSTSSRTSLDGSSPINLGDSSPAGSCLKFNYDNAAETIRLKGPKSAIRQLKNKGRMEIASLPSSPNFIRKSDHLQTSDSVASFRSMSELTDVNINAQIRSHRQRKVGISLTPETLKKFNQSKQIVQPMRSNSEFIKLPKQPNSVKLKKTRFQLTERKPCCGKSELILRAPSSLSLTYLPQTFSNSYKPKRPPPPKFNMLLTPPLTTTEQEIDRDSTPSPDLGLQMKPISSPEIEKEMVNKELESSSPTKINSDDETSQSGPHSSNFNSFLTPPPSSEPIFDQDSSLPYLGLQMKSISSTELERQITNNEVELSQDSSSLPDLGLQMKSISLPDFERQITNNELELSQTTIHSYEETPKKNKRPTNDKPKRPPLPKLIIQNTETTTEFIYRF